MKDIEIYKTLKKLRDELLEGKGYSVGLEWISKHCNMVANSFATMSCDIQLVKEGGVKLFGFLPENEFYKIEFLSGREKDFQSFLMRRCILFGIKILDF